MIELCKECGAMICQHKDRADKTYRHNNGYRAGLQSQISLGETVGERISHVSYHDNLAANRFEDDGNPLPGRGMGQVVTPSTETPKQSIIDIAKDWVQCNLCSSRIFYKYLDQHMMGHTHAAERKTAATVAAASSSLQTIKSQTGSTALVRVSDTTTNLSSSSSRDDDDWVSLFKSSSSSKDKSTLQPREIYKFRDLNYVCAASSVARSGRYSDFTVVFWTDEFVNVSNNSYFGAGYSSTTYKDWERLQIHTVYDSRENWYTLSCKLLKRGQYSSWDSEDAIPDRICYQHELGTEIKRAMLFFRINPKAAYKLFRKLFNEELIIDRDADGKAMFVQTKNCETLNKKLKSSSINTSTHTYSNENYRHLNGYEGNYD